MLLIIICCFMLILPKNTFGFVGCGTLIEDKCPNSNVTFWLYTKNNTPYKLDDNSPTSIENAPFNNNTIKILVHGYAGNRSSQINQYLRPEYLSLDYNVISVDYTPATADPCYLETVKNAPIISRCFTEFLILLLETQNRYRKIAMDDIHVLGFGMGAHISAKTGKDLVNKYSKILRRLTGLDAAGPLYPLIFSKISSESAKFVDVIHTNVGLYAVLASTGTVNFYCNNIALQPGCSPIDMRMCHHVRALEYYAESIRKRKNKFCGRNILLPKKVEMGERVPLTARGVYVVETSSASPYALDTAEDC